MSIEEREIKERLNNVGSLCNFLNKHPKHVEFIESQIIDLSAYDLGVSEKLYYYINKIDSPILCICDKHKKYRGFKNGYYKTCGDKECYKKSRKTTSLKKYGVDNPRKSKEVQDKYKATMVERYGTDIPMKSEKIRAKFNTTMKEKYGVEWAQQNKDIAQKSLDTWNSKPQEYKDEVSEIKRINGIKPKWEQDIIEEKKNATRIEKYGSLENYHKMVQMKISKTSMERYGVDHFFKSPEIAEKRINSYIGNKLDNIADMIGDAYELINVLVNENKTDNVITIKHLICGNITEHNRQFIFSRYNNNEEFCKICNPIVYGISRAEKEVAEFLKDYVDIEENIKIENKEIDIYIPSFKLGIEYNGLFWHSELYKDSKFHLDKTRLCNENGISLFHIWEDQWIHKPDIIKSMLRNKIGMSPYRIYGRKCEIKEVSAKDTRNFLDKNHLQGSVGSKIKIGLYHNNLLVSIMTFGGLRTNLGQKSIDGSYELLRFCNILNTNVIGGASKLFKHFIKNYEYNDIISYASRDYSNGELYETLGMSFVKETIPNYFYINKRDVTRENRFKYRKDILIKEGFDKEMTEHEIMLIRNYFRIYDTGSYKYITSNT